MTQIVRLEEGFISSPTTLPVVTAGIYSAKDVVGGLITFPNVVRNSGGVSRIDSFVLCDESFVANLLNLWLFSVAPAAPIADNGVFDPPDNELLNVVGVIPIVAADYIQATDNQVVTVRNIGLEFTVTGTSLYGYLVCVGTPTYAAVSDLVGVKLGGIYKT